MLVGMRDTRDITWPFESGGFGKLVTYYVEVVRFGWLAFKEMLMLGKVVKVKGVEDYKVFVLEYLVSSLYKIQILMN